MPLRLHEDIFDHVHMDPEAAERIGKFIESHERLTLTTVGIDIGSSTSHLLFAKVVLEREAQSLSSRYVVVRREVVWRSPIMLTPFTASGTIDAKRLGDFIERCYREAGVAREEIDTGAVILTGEAIKKSNAQAIDELFASEAGKFVCATAGHQLEAMLAAHGSGAVRLSKEGNSALLHVDVGGGTTKLALVDRGVILGVCAFAVGGRLLATDETGAWTRIDDSAAAVARELGIPADPAAIADPATRERIVARLADVAMAVILGKPLDPLARSLLLTPELERSVEPAALTFSGGVAEYVFEREEQEFGDIAKPLARALRERFGKELLVPVIDPGVGIRATVIGASQFTVQVSGKTIYVSPETMLPLRNVPVVRMQIPEDLSDGLIDSGLLRSIERLDLAPGDLMALAFEWSRDPHHGDLHALGSAIARVTQAARRERPLVLLIDGDVGQTVGHLMREELGIACELISIDGVDLHDLDFVDVGELVNPPGVIPLVIKSLVFQ